jgi:hypothetical protein
LSSLYELCNHLIKQQEDLKNRIEKQDRMIEELKRIPAAREKSQETPDFSAKSQNFQGIENFSFKQQPRLKFPRALFSAPKVQKSNK